MLNLQFNQLGDGSAFELAKALESNHVVKEIELWKNKIQSPGLGTIADALKHNTGLRMLHLNFNSIGMGTDVMPEARQNALTFSLDHFLRYHYGPPHAHRVICPARVSMLIGCSRMLNDAQ